MSGIVKYYNELIGGFEGTGGNADTHTKGSGADVQIFTTTGSDRTWVKPAWATTVYMEVKAVAEVRWRVVSTMPSLSLHH
jgi:hypothetical protein